MEDWKQEVLYHIKRNDFENAECHVPKDTENPLQWVLLKCTLLMLSAYEGDDKLVGEVKEVLEDSLEL